MPECLWSPLRLGIQSVPQGTGEQRPREDVDELEASALLAARKILQDKAVAIDERHPRPAAQFRSKGRHDRIGLIRGHARADRNHGTLIGRPTKASGDVYQTTVSCS